MVCEGPGSSGYWLYSSDCKYVISMTRVPTGLVLPEHLVTLILNEL